MNFVEYTNRVISKMNSTDNVLIVGAGFEINNNVDGPNIYQNDPDYDLNDWIHRYLNKEFVQLFDCVLLSRVFEHFPARHVDWYLYNIYSIMKKGAKLICVVPDMIECAKEIEESFDNKKIVDIFKVNRLNYELLSEGDHIWDRHATWTSENSMRYYLEMEGLFKIREVNYIRIDSDIVPKELEIVAERR